MPVLTRKRGRSKQDKHAMTFPPPYLPRRPPSVRSQSHPLIHPSHINNDSDRDNGSERSESRPQSSQNGTADRSLPSPIPSVHSTTPGSSRDPSKAIDDRDQGARTLRRPPTLHRASFRIEGSVPEEIEEHLICSSSTPVTECSSPDPRFGPPRPRSHPPSRIRGQGADSAPRTPRISYNDDLWRMPNLAELQQPTRPTSPPLSPRPKASFARLSSLDNLIAYRDEKAEWKRASSSAQQGLPDNADAALITDLALLAEYRSLGPSPADEADVAIEPVDCPAPQNDVEKQAPSIQSTKFRHSIAEVGFCFTIAMTQLLAEYLISGFAIEVNLYLAKLQHAFGPGALGQFWPASLLSLMLSATLLIFARISDMYGGYFVFMFGICWLAIWTFIPGFYISLLMLDISRAMQGLAIAAFMPSTFAMISSVYSEGPRRNFVMGLYSGCAPLGFFLGFLVAGALPSHKPGWYFWIAAALSTITALTAYLTVPHDKTDRRSLNLKMDWLGGFLITAGLILVAYSLAVEPYANQFDQTRNGFTFPLVWGPFTAGCITLIVAIGVEGWYAACPLLPLEFFRPKGVKAFCFAGLCFYASYGVWLYGSANYFQTSTDATSDPKGLSGVHLAVWYTPTAVVGLVLCVVSGKILHLVPIQLLLVISGVAWIVAPLLLGVVPVPLNYWSTVLPSMLCATIGIDLTFTISIIFLSSVQPLRYQGLSGAVCSILVNLAMSFSLPISEIVITLAQKRFAPTPTTQGLPSSAEGGALDKMLDWGYQASFFYAAASAGVGLVICLLFVRISRSVVRKRAVDEESPRASSSEVSTLVDGQEGADTVQTARNQ